MPTRLVLGVVAAVVVMGCAGDDPPDPPSPVPTTTSPTTETSEVDDEQALRQLTEAWYQTIQSIYVEGADPSDAKDFIAGEYLANFLEDVQERRDSGLTSRR